MEGINHADLARRNAVARRMQLPPGGPTGFSLMKASTGDYDVGWGATEFNIANLPPYQSSSTGSTSMFPPLTTADQIAVLVHPSSLSTAERGGMYRAQIGQLALSSGGGGSGFPVGPTTVAGVEYQIALSSTLLGPGLFTAARASSVSASISDMVSSTVLSSFYRIAFNGAAQLFEQGQASVFAGAVWGISMNSAAWSAQISMGAPTSASTAGSIIGFTANQYNFDNLSTSPSPVTGILYRVGNVVHITT